MAENFPTLLKKKEQPNPESLKNNKKDKPKDIKHWDIL